MSSFLKASLIFDNSLESTSYFESLSAEYTKNSILKEIKTNKLPLIFLVGEPGVGKTYMIDVIISDFITDKKVLSTSEPFSTPESFLHFLLKDEKFDKNLTFSELNDKVQKLYKNIDNLIVIDEAQLLDNSVLEFIRVLSDTGYFRFLLSMHKEEGVEIVKKTHFISRDHRVIELGILEDNEVRKYIEGQLLKNGLGDMVELFKKQQIKYIQKIAKGNFRIIKQLLKHIFSIMDYAKTNGHTKYITPNDCVITMAGIDLGVIDA